MITDLHMQCEKSHEHVQLNIDISKVFYSNAMDTCMLNELEFRTTFSLIFEPLHLKLSNNKTFF